MSENLRSDNDSENVSPGLNVLSIYDPPGWEGSEGLIAIIVPPQPILPGCQFVTDPESLLQVGFMRRATGSHIAPHIHPDHVRYVRRTTEVLIVKSGLIRVTLYNSSRVNIGSYHLLPGTVLILVSGGHEFLFLEDSEVVEVKQGPYAGAKDKVVFSTTSDHTPTELSEEEIHNAATQPVEEK